MIYEQFIKFFFMRNLYHLQILILKKIEVTIKTISYYYHMN